LDLPAAVGRLIILTQNDPPRSPAATALRKACAAQRAKGRDIAVLRPPTGVKDINELAQLLHEDAAAP
jgi:hypothetical protein